MKFKVNGDEIFASTGGRPFDKNKPLIIFVHGSGLTPVSYTHLRAHETGRNLVCRLLLEKKKKG